MGVVAKPVLAGDPAEGRPRARKTAPPAELVAAYIQAGAQGEGAVEWRADTPDVTGGHLRLLSARILVDGEPAGDVPIDRDVAVEYDFEVRGARANVTSSIHLFDKQGGVGALLRDRAAPSWSPAGTGTG